MRYRLLVLSVCAAVMCLASPTEAQVAAVTIETSELTQVAAGTYHTCALTTAGGVLCWGGNEEGQLGDGTRVERHTPAPVSGLSGGITAIAAGESHTCGISVAGALWCWGDNRSGQLGDGTTVIRDRPIAVVGLSERVTAVSAGFSHTCALTETGAVWCWGNNYEGQLGTGSSADQSLTPAPVAGLGSGVSAIGGGYAHSCAVQADGAVVCWGRNVEGQLGDGTRTTRRSPVPVVGMGAAVVRLSVSGDGHTCAVTTAGALKCWGENGVGQLGDGTFTRRLTPVDVIGLTGGVVAVGGGQAHTCARLSGDGIKCWGANGQGQLGDGSFTGRAIPADVVGLSSGAVDLSVGKRHSCAARADFVVLCWGSNYRGQLGDGTTENRPNPVEVVPWNPYDTVIPVTTTNPAAAADGLCSLVEAIRNANANNQSGSADCPAGVGHDLITLIPGEYLFTAIDNYQWGPNALPPIASAVTIEGNGATLRRSTTAPAMRFLRVRPGASLTLRDLTLQAGIAFGGKGDFGGGGGAGGAGLGGAIFNEGNLQLEHCTLRDNQARGGDGGNGGGDTLGGPAGNGGGIGKDALLNKGAGYDGDGIDRGGWGGTWSNDGESGGPGGGGGGGGGGEFRYWGGEGGFGGWGGGGGGGGDSGWGGVWGGNGGDGGWGGGGGGGGGSHSSIAGGRGSSPFGGGAGGTGGGPGWGGGGGGGLGMGGAVFSLGGTVNILNSTLHSNIAQGGAGGAAMGVAAQNGQPGHGYGGALGATAGAQVSLRQVTLLGNQAELGGGLYGYGATVHITVHNSAFSNTSAGDCAGTPLAANVSNRSDATCGAANVSPTGFDATLTDNGGLTPTVALLPGSNAIDAGDPASCPLVDQRGVGRPQDGNGDGQAVCDIGAFELEAIPPTAIGMHGAAGASSAVSGAVVALLALLALTGLSVLPRLWQRPH